jgi:hypothetical protein
MDTAQASLLSRHCSVGTGQSLGGRSKKNWCWSSNGVNVVASNGVNLARGFELAPLKPYLEVVVGNCFPTRLLLRSRK